MQLGSLSHICNSACHRQTRTIIRSKHPLPSLLKARPLATRFSLVDGAWQHSFKQSYQKREEDPSSSG